MTFPSGPQQVAGRSRRVRPELPRLVEQTRILTWFQFYVALLILLVQLIVLGTTPEPNGLGDAYDQYQQLTDMLAMLMLTLVATSVLLGTAAAFLRRGFAIALLLAILAEATVAVDIWFAARVGVLSTALVVLLAILGCWITINLFRGEVLRFVLRRSS